MNLTLKVLASDTRSSCYIITCTLATQHNNFFKSITVIKISTVDLDQTWSITEAVNKLQATPQSEWLFAFHEGVDLEDKVVHDTFGEQNEEDFIARYDLSFLTPRHQPMRCKVSFSD